MSYELRGPLIMMLMIGAGVLTALQGQKLDLGILSMMIWPAVGLLVFFSWWFSNSLLRGAQRWYGLTALAAWAAAGTGYFIVWSAFWLGRS